MLTGSVDDPGGWFRPHNDHVANPEADQEMLLEGRCQSANFCLGYNFELDQYRGRLGRIDQPTLQNFDGGPSFNLERRGHRTDHNLSLQWSS